MKDKTKWQILVGILLVVIVGAFATGYFTVSNGEDSGDGLADTSVWDTGVQKIISQLNVTTTIKYSNSRTTAAGQTQYQ